MGCGSSTTTAPSTTAPSARTAPHAFPGSALSWLTAVARPWNKTLNDDQAVVVRDGASGSKSGASTFFSRLAAACTRLSDDALRAGEVEAAPSTTLESDWTTMAARTKAYAASCLTVTRTHAAADLTLWNDSLKALDSANATLNAEVAGVRGAAGSTGG
jgi:hypothetical protein